MQEFGPKAENEKAPSLDAPLAEHVAYLYRHIYGLPFSYHENGSRRYIHSILHAVRAAIYIPALANLYRKFGDQEALAIANEDLKLIQIAALLHDSGREGDGVDMWDQDSGILTYKYLLKLGVAKEKAKLLAEAVTNKDTTTKNVTANEIASTHYEELDISGSEPIWRQVPKKEKNIYQRLIHDADCLDIIRVRSVYEGTYLDFFKEIIRQDNAMIDTYPALDYLERLITEAEALIKETEKNGNRDQFENEKCLDLLLKKIENKEILAKFYSEKLLFSSSELNQLIIPGDRYDAKKGLDEKNIVAAFREGKVYARTMQSPAIIATRANPHQDTCSNKDKYKTETVVGLELRKTIRKNGISTGSSKPDNKDKQGNPNRSISMIGYGRGVFRNVGFLLVNPSLDKIGNVFESNAGTGRGKKKNVTKITDASIKKQKLDELLWKFKLTRGGNSTYSHTEILCDIEDYHAIFFTKDNPSCSDSQSLELQAIYIQQEYKRIFGKQLPIFEYSVTQNSLVARKYNDDDLVQLWKKLYEEKVNSISLSTNALLKLIHDSKDKNILNIIKSYIASGEDSQLDIHYSSDLKDKISHVAINIIIEKLSNDPAFIPDLLIHLNIIKDSVLLTKILEKCKSYNEDNLCKLIIAAMEKGNSEVINLLLSNGFNVNQKNNAGDTPLLIAAKAGNLNVVRNLLINHSDINYKNTQDNSTALHFAVINGQIDLVNCLLNAGANPNVVNNDGEKPLNLAVECDYVDIIKALLNKKSSPILANNNDNTSIELPANISDIELYRLLINYADNLHYVNESGDHLIHIAVARANSTLLTHLLEIDHTLINKQTKNGGTALHIAVLNHVHPDIITILLANGADLNIKNLHGETPLAVAMNNDNDKSLDLILGYINYNTDLKVFNNDGYNLLHLAAQGDNYPLMKHLLEKDQSLVNLQAANHDTALHIAITNSNIEMIILLLKNGADINIKDSSYDTALDLALRLGEKKVISAIADNINEQTLFQESIKRILFYAVDQDLQSLIKYIVEKYPSIIDLQNNGDTLLHAALNKSYNSGMVELLLELGANPNIKNNTGETPLHIAVSNENKDLVEILIKNKADPNATDQEGLTPLARASKILDNADLIAALINSNIDLKMVDKQGYSYLHLAVKNNNYFLVDLLVKKEPSIIDLQTYDGYTASSIALRNNNLSLLYRLIISGANQYLKYINGETVFELAISKGIKGLPEIILDYTKDISPYREIIKNALGYACVHNISSLVNKIIKKDKTIVNTKIDEYGNHFPLYLAIFNDDTTAACDLLDNNANPNIITYGRSLLQSAAYNDNLIIVKALLAKNADPNLIDPAGETALDQALFHNNDKIFEVLLDSINYIPDLKKCNEKGYNALHLAVKNNNISLVKKLLKIDPSLINSVTTVDVDSETALHIAIRDKNADITALLLDLGADPHIKNKNSKTPFDISNDNDIYDKEVQVAIIQHAKNLSADHPYLTGTLNNAVLRNFGNLVNIIIQNDNKMVNTILSNGLTPLQTAMVFDHDEIADLLLNANADPNFKTKDEGLTALSLAAIHHSVHCITKLLNNKIVDLNMADNKGHTPAHYAALKNHTDIMTSLAEAGADLSLVDNDGKTPLDIAIELKHQEMIDLIQRYTKKRSLSQAPAENEIIIQRPLATSSFTLFGNDRRKSTNTDISQSPAKLQKQKGSQSKWP